MPEDASGLYPLQGADSDLVGYIDREGNWVIEPQFTCADWFSGGLAAAIDPSSGLLGYIDTNGDWAIKAQYPYQSGEKSSSSTDYTKDPPVTTDEGVTKIQSFRGADVFVWRFSEGLAAVTDILDYGSESEARYGYIDAMGNTVVEKKYPVAFPFCEGLAAVQDEESGLMGYINPDGSWAIEPIYGYANSFSEGYAVVQDAESGGRGFIDKTGVWIIEPNYPFASGFSEELAAVIDPETGKLGYLDTGGAWAIEPRFESPTLDSRNLMPYTLPSQSFSEGLAMAYLEDGGTCGYIDRQGDWAIEPQFFISFSSRFSDGIAVVDGFPGGGTGCINKEGEWVLAPSDRYLATFAYGMAVIQDDTDTHFGYIDTEGNRVI